MSSVKSTNCNALTHALILKFLETNKYHNTLKEFRKEANQIIEGNGKEFDDSSSIKPLLAVVQDYLVDELKKNLENWSLDEIKIDEDLYSSETTLYPKYICETFSQIHTSNILTVRLHNIALSSYVDNDYETTSTPTVITGSADKTVKFTSLLTGDTFNTFDFHKGGILAIDFHPIHPNLMLTSSMDGSCTIMNAFTMEVKQSFRDHRKYVVRAKFSPDGLTIVTAGYDNTLNFYRSEQAHQSENQYLSPTNLTPSAQSPLSPSTPLPVYSKVHTITFESNIESLCFLPNSSHLIVGIRESNYLHYINLRPQSQQQNNFEVTKYNMNSNGDDWVSFTAMDIIPSPNNDGKYLLVSTDDESGRIILFKTFRNNNEGEKGNRSNVLIQVTNFYDTDPPSSPNDLDSLPASPTTFSSGIISRKLTTPRLLWHPSGNYFYSYGIDSNIRVHSLRSKKLVDHIKGHNDVVRGMWYDEERDLLVTCGFDKCVKIWCSDESSSREVTIRELLKEEKMYGLLIRRNTII